MASRKVAGVEIPGVPDLPGWKILPVAGLMLGVARQRMFQMIGEGKIQTIHKLPGAGAAETLEDLQQLIAAGEEPRPAAYVMADWEIEKMLEEQRAAVRARAARQESLEPATS